MSELIDREDLKSAIRNKYASLEDRCEINEIINAQPSVDSVVHCKDCVHHENTSNCKGWIYCKIIGRSLTEDSFCSFGEMDEDTEREDNK